MVNLECRMYEAEFPEVDTPVMVQIKSINPGVCAYVSLLEYDNMKGMLSFTELSRRRIRNVASLVKVGRIGPVMVLNVEKEKNYINLSKSRVSQEDIEACEQRYNKSKHVHSILCRVAETLNIDLKVLYKKVGWPLYRKYGHAFEAFKLIASDPHSVFDSLTCEIKDIGPDGEEVIKLVPAVTEEVKDELIKNIRRHLNLQPLKVRAEVQLTCFEFDGVLHIKEAIRKANATGTEDCPVTVRLFAAPMYVFDTLTLDKEQGISILNKAIASCTEEMKLHNGTVIVKQAPRTVNERDEQKLFSDYMLHPSEDKEESNCSEISEEVDTGIGELDDSNWSLN